MPRRMAYYDYSDPGIAPQAFSVTLSAIGGFIFWCTRAYCFLYAPRDRASATAGKVPATTAGVPQSIPLAPCLGAQHLRDLGGADDRADRHQLRLSDPDARVPFG